MVWCSNCAKNCPRPASDGGFLCCTTCGRVIDQDNFAEEPTFFKNAAGQSQLSGNFVRTVQSDYSASRERILSIAREDMSDLARGLEMDDGDTIIRPALAFYRLALERNFTRGRRRELVEATCLYIACRENKKPYLLIDFSDFLKVNVYVLGSTFLQLCKVLSLQEHPFVQKPIDPSLFIHRFANRLVEGKDYMVVARTALRIIASMKRDWMQTGRKPSGLCGAALYISALSHDHKFSKSDIVRIVHICEATLTKRLIEFENTESGSLTIEEFEKRAKELDGANNHSKQANLASKKNETSELLCEHKGKGRVAFAHGLCESCYHDFIDLSGGLEGGSEPPAFQRAERERLAKENVKETADNICFATDPCQELESDVQDMETVGENRYEELQSTEPSKDFSGAFTDQVDEVGTDKVCGTDGMNDESDHFSDIDDSEVDGYLFNEVEQKHYKIVWEEMNREYVEEHAAKEEAAAAAKKAEEARLNNCSPEERAALELAAAAKAALVKSKKENKQKRAAEARNAPPPQTALEATRQMLTKKGFSSKINYDVLDNLFVAPIPKKIRTDKDSVIDEHLPPTTGKENNSNVSQKHDELPQDDAHEVDGEGYEAYDENPYYENEEDYDGDYDVDFL